MSALSRSRYLDDDSKYLEFGLSDERYAIRLLDVQEVIPVPDVSDLPGSPESFLGLMNLRGAVVAIFDLKKRMGVKGEPQDPEKAVIITSIHGFSIGLEVDRIHQVLGIDEEEVRSTPEVNGQINGKHIIGVHQSEHFLTVLLDLPSVFKSSSLQQLHARMKG